MVIDEGNTILSTSRYKPTSRISSYFSTISPIIRGQMDRHLKPLPRAPKDRLRRRVPLWTIEVTAAEYLTRRVALHRSDFASDQGLSGNPEALRRESARIKQLVV